MSAVKLGLALAALVLAVVLSPLRAAAATVPMLTAYDAALRPTATAVLGTTEAVRPEAHPRGINDYDGASLAYGGQSNLRVAADPSGTSSYGNRPNPPAAAGTGAAHAYGGALKRTERSELAEGVIYAALAATFAAEAAPEAFTVADRVAGQLADSRLGPLAGKITPEALQDLASNPNALKFLDTASGHTNTVQLVEGRLLRITTAGDDASRIISVGPMQRNGLFNGIANGRFTPLIEDP